MGNLLYIIIFVYAVTSSSRQKVQELQNKANLAIKHFEDMAQKDSALEDIAFIALTYDTFKRDRSFKLNDFSYFTKHAFFSIKTLAQPEQSKKFNESEISKICAILKNGDKEVKDKCIAIDEILKIDAIDKIAKSIQILKEQLAGVDKKIEELKKKIDETGKLTKAQKQQLAEVDKKIEELKKKIDETLDTKALKQQLAGIDKKIEELKKKIDEILDTKAQKQQLDKKIEELKKKIDEIGKLTKAQKQQLDSEIEGLKKKIENAGKLTKALKEQLDSEFEELKKMIENALEGKLTKANAGDSKDDSDNIQETKASNATALIIAAGVFGFLILLAIVAFIIHRRRKRVRSQ